MRVGVTGKLVVKMNIPVAVRNAKPPWAGSEAAKRARVLV